jgi:hypothetical protein
LPDQSAARRFDTSSAIGQFDRASRIAMMDLLGIACRMAPRAVSGAAASQGPAAGHSTTLGLIASNWAMA